VYASFLFVPSGPNLAVCKISLLLLVFEAKRIARAQHPVAFVVSLVPKNHELRFLIGRVHLHTTLVQRFGILL
jgi:hypothetical protein